MSDGSGGSSEDNTKNVDYGLEEFEGEEDTADGDASAGDAGAGSAEDAGTGAAPAPEDASDAGGVPEWSGGDPSASTDPGPGSSDQGGPLLDPDSMVDDTLTVIVGAAAGVVIGFVTTVALLVSTTSVWLGLGLGAVAWLGSTAYLVRRRSVVGAVSRGAYGVAIALLLVPFVAFSPATETGGLADRAAGFLAFTVFMAVPGGIAALVGYVASRFDPADGDREW